MSTQNSLTQIQVDLARIFFAQEASHGYLLAGGAALIAADLVNRPTHDLDFFASAPITSVVDARDQFIPALEKAGYQVSVIQESETFCRMIVAGATDRILVDLAIDSPPNSTPMMTVLGPTLAPEELAARKLLALFGRAEARDFCDVYLLAARFGKAAMLRQAGELDAGFDHVVVAQMMDTIARFSDDQIPLPLDEVPQAREFFRTWAQELR